MFDSTNFDIFRQDWTKETGTLPMNLTNDYLFKSINQLDNTALKGLICAVLHRKPEQILTANVLNPIMLGRAIDEKEFILDVKVSLNDEETIDMEMQVVNYDDWPERSLQYLCRTYDSLHRGEEYSISKTAIHIGIMNFNLFGNESSLLESYRLMNVKTHQIYTDKFQLYILSLPEANNPTEEDKLFHTDLWAKFFRAKTWEELKMLAKEDEGIASAISTANILWADEDVQARALAREDYNRRVKTEKRKLQMAQDRAKAAEDRLKTAEESVRIYEEKTKALDEQSKALEEESRILKEENARLHEELDELKRRLEAAGIK